MNYIQHVLSLTPLLLSGDVAVGVLWYRKALRTTRG